MNPQPTAADELQRPRLGYVGDGRNYHVRRWLPAIVRAGADVSLFTFDPPFDPLEGVRVRKLERWFRKKPSYVDYLTPAAQVRRLVDEEGCDILMGSYATHYGWLAARTRFAPFVMQTWTGDLTKYPFEGPKRFFFFPVVHYGLDHADLITTDGVALLEEGRRLFPEFAHKMVATRWGIDIARSTASPRAIEALAKRLRLPANTDARVVTAPRGLQHWYRPELVVSSLHEVLDSDPAAIAIVLTLGHEADGPVVDMLKELAGHPRARIVSEFLSADDMAAVWAVSDVVVSIPHADGISESVLEAAYAGASLVLSDIPSNRSLLADGLKGKLAGETASDVADAVMQTLRRSPKSLKEDSDWNRRWVETNATVQQTATMLVERLRRLVDAD